MTALHMLLQNTKKKCLQNSNVSSGRLHVPGNRREQAGLAMQVPWKQPVPQRNFTAIGARMGEIKNLYKNKMTMAAALKYWRHVVRCKDGNGGSASHRNNHLIFASTSGLASFKAKKHGFQMLRSTHVGDEHVPEEHCRKKCYTLKQFIPLTNKKCCST